MRRLRIFAALSVASFSLFLPFLFPQPVLAAIASNVQVVCATPAGAQNTWTIGWNNSQQFFENKGYIPAFFCTGGYAGPHTVYVSDTLTDASLGYYNGVITSPPPTTPTTPTPTPSETETSTTEPTPTPSPSPSDSSTSSSEPSPTPSASPTPSDGATATPTPEPESSPSSEPSPTPTESATSVSPETSTSTAEPTPSPTPTEPSQNSDTPSVVSFIAGIVSEGGILELIAPVGKVFTEVLFASYGTPTDDYALGQCHAESTPAIIAQIFLGKNSAVVSAINELFGDPCGGTYKKLAVKLSYGVDTSTVTIDTSTTVSPTPSPTPTPQPETQPVVTPTPTPQPEPQPTPTPSPQPEPSPVTPSPEPTAPEPQPVPQPQPIPEPEPAVIPEPTPMPEPTPSPEEPQTPEPDPVPEDDSVEEIPTDTTNPEDTPVEEDSPSEDSSEPTPVEEETPVETPSDPTPPVEVDETPESEDSQTSEEEEVQTPQEPEQKNPMQESSPNPTTTEAAVAAVLAQFGDAPVSVSSLIEAGLSFKDLPPETPVDVRTDESGNPVIITAEVAAALTLLENPSELIGALFSDPGQALLALGSIGADMSPQEREEAQKMVIATVIAAGAAMNAVAAAGGVTRK